VVVSVRGCFGRVAQILLSDDLERLGETVRGVSDGTVDGDTTIKYDRLSWSPDRCRDTSTITGSNIFAASSSHAVGSSLLGPSSTAASSARRAYSANARVGRTPCSGR